MASRAILVSLCLAGCATAGRASGDVDARAIPGIDAADIDAPAREIDAAPGDPDAPPGTPDARPGAPDARPPDARPPDAMPSGVGTSLLLSEVELAPTGGEFIEIVNPTAQAVALDHYYLSDNGTYWQLPAGAETLDAGDFIVKFKNGQSIPSHGVVTVAMDTAGTFKTANAVNPTYSIADATVDVVSKSGTPGLTNTGEVIVLFTWDGASDLVTDVDLMLAGKPAAGNGLVAKSGMAQDGPDTGGTTTAYKTDADAIANQSATPGSGKSTKRVLLETGHETQAGTGNGAGGDDETSEATAITWDTTYTAPTPGAVPAALLP